ncbi:type II 3-dehydroquinate dehydratase [Acholeplasma granularum]|uniref:type II 3-dehydroquinate dehydratase n=1 Tax=Acholeplasma granularum TaxID=264635 RepID=UPI0004706D6A|nr:type II 3-dehydroquinate dehydratase [Acholeplasma granularum]
MNILIINGPNLNMLGKRDPVHYGKMTLNELNDYIRNSFKDINFDFFQSNHEGEIIDYIQTTLADALIINPAAYTHTSLAIRDALEIFNKIKVEVHLSNINEREEFRKVNYIKDVCDASFLGKKEQSYIEAIEYILDNFRKLK